MEGGLGKKRGKGRIAGGTKIKNFGKKKGGRGWQGYFI